MMDRRRFMALGGLTAAGTLGAAPLVSAATARAHDSGHGTPDWNALRRSVDGKVLLPGDEGYDFAHSTYIKRYDAVRPAAVVQAARAEDIAETVKFARRFGVRTVARSGGHSFGGYSTSPGIVVDLSPMNRTTVSDGLARVQSGTKLVDMQRELLSRGITISGGMCPTVGISGLTLGGGFGMAGRRHGLTSDRLTSIRVVLANGRIVTCDPHHEPDLFWALRGGGCGSYGFVSDFEFEPFPADDPTVFELHWPWPLAAKVLPAWQRWAPKAPDDLSAGMFVRSPDPAVEPMLYAFGQWGGAPADLDAHLDRLTAMVGQAPSKVVRKTMPYMDAVMHWAGCSELTVSQCHGEGQTPDAKLQRFEYALTKSSFFTDVMTPEAVQTLVKNFTAPGAGAQLRGLEFHAFGGAYNRPRPGKTAFVHRRQRFLLQYLAQVPMDSPEAHKTAVTDWARTLHSSMLPWASGESYQNYTDPELKDWRQAYYGSNYRRLVEVKHRYDPERFFDFPQAIGR
ncbi:MULTISPECIES: FAD-binding oxidoreductase [unclassified Streptomyces]|uniref:FAD-binding oxidoreductase n=1 Tax=unclassified Streptomyces TaxID=2593676 RepID=UPI002DDB5F5A|nr:MULTISPECIES: FAD-binding oxidoreductase [unclassified Streptomyces]WSA91186.1 FAD-binding oxidoreductase [Streptomyces sp. NBC_01795]WSB75511.1 FAD-binding oxidoreductase [Streptomyces sp. NBC_01775]WSS16206.1 FAD-binding oxidoreductase [Streptomyces sp. NBC_01186]WSS45024.1 FAD-binding oxidoreductase [Streptomyces sp. NBC_01187]